jgi:hypothetical protein
MRKFSFKRYNKVRNKTRAKSTKIYIEISMKTPRL